MSLNYGAPTALNVLAGPNAPTGGAVDTLAFSSLNFGNWYSVTETIAPTNANVVIAGPAAAEVSQAPASTQVATLDLDGTSTGNQITGAIVDNASGSANNAAAILKSNSGKWTLYWHKHLQRQHYDQRRHAGVGRQRLDCQYAEHYHRWRSDI